MVKRMILPARNLTLLLVASALVCVASGSASAQPGRLQTQTLDHLLQRATETVEVTLDGGMLQMVSRFLNSSKPDEARIREIIQGLQGVYVKSLEFSQDNEYTVADVETIRMQLNTPGWSKLATVRSQRSGDNVDVHLMLDNGVIQGVAVLVADPRRVTVVNVVGTIDPEKISQMGLLEGRFGIPKLDLDWGITRRTNRNN